MRQVRKQTGIKLCLEFLHWLKGPSPEGLTQSHRHLPTCTGDGDQASLA